uniref:RHS repeat-associated core domain-containing protein n=1 Tax=Chryseobacterium endophyticum TaxID=1854762 RepID=A0AAU6WSQ0_9FLAO
MDSVSHELMGVHTSPSNDKIIVTKDPAKAGKVTSFTIIDTKGNRYLFDKNNINTYESGFINNRTKQLINSGFFLSKILNNKNEEVANIEYETTTELVNQFVGSVQQQKIKKINVNGIGSIEYIYRYNNQPHLLVSQWIRDWYVIEKVVLKDTHNQIINQYFFDNLDNGYFRELINLDKNGNQIQKFAFEYNNEFSTGGRMDAFGYPNAFNGCDMDSGILPSVQGTNPATSFYGSLERIILPTGGKIEYEFESNSYFKEETCGYNEFCYYDYYDFDKIYTLNFDTKYGAILPLIPYRICTMQDRSL